MIILAIETSCDDTGIALLKIKTKKAKGKSELKILSNVVSSQVKLHAKYGGVWPFLAQREHKKNLPIVFKKARKEAKNPKVDLIAATSGPGLEPCLWSGVNFANHLAAELKLPIIPVNHVEAHILVNFLNNFKFPILNLKFLFPAVCLVVSGGHTQLILMKDIGKYKILGETRDDAAGECFDKTARILGLGYPGGPAIAAAAAKKIAHQKKQNQKIKIKLPRPMIHHKNYDFSFSGLKTAVFYDYKTREPEIRKSKDYIREMAKEIQQSIIDVLIAKTLKAAEDFKVKSIILGGGVAANEKLRREFKRLSLKEKLTFLVPAKEFCTDNAVMIAVASYFSWLKGKKGLKEIKADANLRIR